MIVDRLDVGLDFIDLGIGRKITLTAEQEHEWLMETSLNNTAEWSPVDVDACLAPGIIMAELRGLRPTEGVTQYSYPRQVKPARKPAGHIQGVQLFQVIEHE